MDADNCANFNEWLDLEADDRLEPEQRRALDRHVAGCAECSRERQALAALGRVLERSRVGVRSGFTADVLRRLPATGWEGSAPRAWRAPVAVLALLVSAAAALVGLASARMHPGVPFAGALAALGDLFQTAALAGAGMLTASWRGIGLAAGQLLTTSTGSLIAFVILVVAVDLLLLSLLRRRPAAAEQRSRRDRS